MQLQRPATSGKNKGWRGWLSTLFKSYHAIITTSYRPRARARSRSQKRNGVLQARTKLFRRQPREKWIGPSIPAPGQLATHHLCFASLSICLATAFFEKDQPSTKRTRNRNQTSTAVTHPRQAKVRQLEVTLCIDENVLRLEIPVKDAVAVAEPHRVKELVQIRLRVLDQVVEGGGGGGIGQLVPTPRTHTHTHMAYLAKQSFQPLRTNYSSSSTADA